MEMSKAMFEHAQRVREYVQRKTKTVDDGESVTIIAWWTFIMDHAAHQGLDPHQLARDQLEAFIEYAKENVRMIYPQSTSSH